MGELLRLSEVTLAEETLPDAMSHPGATRRPSESRRRA